MCRTLFSTIIFVLLISGSFSTAQQVSDDSETDSTTTEIHGIVKAQRKYSVIVTSGRQDFEVRLPRTAPIQRELVRPKFDLENRVLSMTLPCSGEKGQQQLNQQVELPLPEPVYLKATFSDLDLIEFKENNIQLINRYSLLAQPSVTNSNQLVGRLEQQDNKLYLVRDGSRRPVDLGTRVNLLSGYTIADLIPGTPISLYVLEEAQNDETSLIAQEVRFQPSIKPENVSNLPTLLCLGDMISFGYQKALHEKLGEQYFIYHPPTNCGSSSNWPLLNRWLGDYQQQPWDVILFNAGMLDSSMDKDDYQANLKKWIELLSLTNAKLVWLTTTPIPSGVPQSVNTQLVGKVPGRMDMQNQWAAEVLEDHPEIAVCDLWKVVKSGEEGVFADWWKGKRTQFNYKQSLPLVEALVESIK